ncbi:ABC transporter ATP-binding protein [Rhodococcus erythropolis]|uniref:ABC transporter ATP-binding protein n=1 Tax=Rhodococcus erythropolis TaxID=1833 RepID=UPI001BE7A1C1|nr:ABC transporter ATP-binding protein [Rhodococcus erythropolis]MBT2268976.1 ABC transporter ATP-binding protein [Rhodococcus erythropolis]
MTDNMLTVGGLVAGYRGSRVLDRVELAVREGEVLTLLGRNGAGKSTLVMTLMGLVDVAAGSVTFDGRALTGARTDIIARAGIGLIPQGRRLFASLTVDEHLRIASRRGHSGRWTIPKVYELMPSLERRRRNRGDQLSGGEQQMVAIGRALLGNPRLLLIDEPSDGLAPSVVIQIADVIRALRDEGVSILLVEQDIGAALSIANRVAVMNHGSIALEQDVTEFDSASGEVQSLLGVS